MFLNYKFTLLLLDLLLVLRIVYLIPVFIFYVS